MLPLKDTMRAQTQSWVNWSLIAVNAVVFLYEISLAQTPLERFILNFGLVPAEIDFSRPLSLIPFFTHMFLHGGWVHFLSNMWILFIFGDNVEDKMGHRRYLLFYILAGLAAGLLQFLFIRTGTTPLIGASGAIAGVLGSYFLFFPKARIYTFIPVFILPWIVEIPAILFLAFWFVTQLVYGLLAVTTAGGAQAGGIAWWAHIGGFIFGLLLAKPFSMRRRPEKLYPDEYWPW